MKRELIHIIALIVFAALYFNSCSNNVALKKSIQNNTKVLNDTLEYYENSIGLEVAQKLAFKGSQEELKNLILSKDNEIGQLKEAIKRFKKISNTSQVETVTKIDSIKVPFEVEVPCKFYREIKALGDHYNIMGYVNESGFNLRHLIIPNTQTIVTGVKKTGFLKREYRFEVTNSNPYVTVEKANVYSFEERVKRFGIGVFTGYDYRGQITVGLGLTYDLIRF